MEIVTTTTPNIVVIRIIDNILPSIPTNLTTKNLYMKKVIREVTKTIKAKTQLQMNLSSKKVSIMTLQKRVIHSEAPRVQHCLA